MNKEEIISVQLIAALLESIRDELRTANRLKAIEVFAVMLESNEDDGFEVRSNFSPDIFAFVGGIVNDSARGEDA